MSKKKLPKYDNGGKFWDKLGNAINNTGLAVADTGLSALGATDVIKNDMYKGKSAQGFATAGNVAGGAAKIAAPIVANALLPGSGSFISAGQGVIGSTANQLDPTYQQGYVPNQPPTGFNPMSMIGPAVQAGMQMYPNGGMIGGPNAEVEKQENTLNPDGSTNQYNGPSHDQGGIPTKLDPNTLVFSDRLKLGKKTFAELNKPNMTIKEDKILDDPKKDKRAKLTAELMKTAKNTQSLKLYGEQEALKMKKVGDYAKKLGIDQIPYTMPEREANLSYTEMPSMQGTQGTDRTNHPYTWGNAFAMGGKMPRYDYGGPAGPQTQDQNTGNLGIMQMGYQPGLYQKTLANYYGVPVHPMGPGANNTPYQAPGVVPEQNLANSGQGASISPTVDPSVSNYNPSMSFEGPSTPTNTGSNFDWAQAGKIGTQVGLGLAANAGNIYDLMRSRKADTETYGRVTPNLLDPTQAIRDNTHTFNGAVNSAREASVGNSSTYLNNRRSLAAEKMRANARIRMDYENQNAGIKNQVGMYNNNVGMQETVANAQNQAQARNLRSNALSNIGHNIYQQGATGIKDQNTSDRELQYLKYLAQLYPQGVK